MRASIGEAAVRLWGENRRAYFSMLARYPDLRMSVYRCKNYNLSNLFPARAVALGCVYKALQDRGLSIREDLRRWVDQITSGKVDLEDFEEVIEELRKI